MLEGGEVEMEAEVEDVIDLLVGNVCKNYEEPGPRGSAAIFLLGEEMEGDSPGREEVEGDALMVVFYNSNDASVDKSQVDEDLLADDDVHLAQPSKPIQTHPKTSNKFGRGKRRGGDRKTTGTIDPILASQAADEGGVARHCSPTIAMKSTKKQLIRSLNKSEKKRQMTEDKMAVVTKKLQTATNDCKTRAVLAQERRRESNLALQHADCLMTGGRDEMTTRLCQAARDVADAQQTSAKAIFEEQQSLQNSG